MHAIVRTGGKQVRVTEGEVVDVELLAQQEGNIEFPEVLLVSDPQGNVFVGQPCLSEWKVRGMILETVYGTKVRSLKYKRRKNMRKAIGHRQRYHRVRIESIAKVGA